MLPSSPSSGPESLPIDMPEGFEFVSWQSGGRQLHVRYGRRHYLISQSVYNPREHMAFECDDAGLVHDFMGLASGRSFALCLKNLASKSVLA